jgi:hypothetical protein
LSRLPDVNQVVAGSICRAEGQEEVTVVVGEVNQGHVSRTSRDDRTGESTEKQEPEILREFRRAGPAGKDPWRDAMN